MELSTAHISIVLSVVCMGVVFFGGWYLQSSLMEEQYHNMEQAEQIKQLKHSLIEEQHYRMVHTEIINMKIHDLNSTMTRSTNNSEKVCMYKRSTVDV